LPGTAFPFPLLNPFQAPVLGDSAFVAKYDPAGKKLDASTFGYQVDPGLNDTDAQGIAVDAAGDAYLVSDSAAVPAGATLLGNPNVSGPDLPHHVIIAEIKADWSGLVYDAYLGGADKDYGNAIAVDPAGNAYITGETTSGDLPVTGADNLQT